MSALARTAIRPSNVPRPLAAKALAAHRSFATVQDAPKRVYGGLKDQDRIFTNAYMYHDHLLKGARVCAGCLDGASATIAEVTCSPGSWRLA